ncbi:MAG TPA: TonB-dependent receptor [Terriglobales bacterium]|nr:TonB-dependent receptor [Terriglobales bacterium]
MFRLRHRETPAEWLESSSPVLSSTGNGTVPFAHLSRLAATLVLLALSFPLLVAQSPNTGSLLVVVIDQSGGVIKDANISLVNVATSAVREALSAGDGTATFPALSLTGAYTVTVSKSGFATEQRTNVSLRSGETAKLQVKLLVGAANSQVTVFGTSEGVRTDSQIGGRLESPVIDATPILGRKVTSIPLLNAAFRQAKGTGDLFVNQTYFATGAGSRRTTTVTLDGANNDEAWGRQTAIATVPIGAVQEMTILSSAFSSEFGWTAGPALNIVTKSGTNTLHGEALFLNRPGGMQANRFSNKDFCPSSVPSCVTPSTLTAINPVDIPDALSQLSASIGGRIIKDRTFFFLSSDYTWQDRTTLLSSSLPAFLLPANGRLDYTGHYRQALFNGRLDHKLTPNHNLMVRVNTDRFHDDNPQDAVSGTNAPSVARNYSRRSWTTQANLTSLFGSNFTNEARFAFLNGDPVTRWTAPTISTAYTRAGSVPFTIGQSRFSDLFGRQLQFSDTFSWSLGRHYLRIGGSLMHHTSGGTGNEPGTAILGTFTFRNTTTLPFDQLTLADVQNYTQPINFGISSYELSQWLNTAFVQDHIRLRNDLTVDLGLRYDRQTLTDARANFAPRIGFAWNPGGDSRTAIRGGYGMYYTQIISNLVAGYLVNGLDGLTTYTATPGQFGFPTCLTGPCLPLAFDPKTLPPSQLPARDIVIRPGQREFYTAQFTKYGLDFSKVPDYPERLVNPRSQVISIGAERELLKGLFLSGDYVHQHWTRLVRSVDLNAPSVFDRTSPGQVRSVAAANATRPILPVNGGVRQINVLTNLGVADYDGLQTQFNYRGSSRMYLAVSYTLSKATNTTEPDGNGIAPDQGNLARLGEIERGPSVLDQRHRAVIMFSYQLPLHFNAGTLMQFASARPFNATTGIDNNGDGANNDRPVVNGEVMRKSAFRGSPTSDVGMFVENRIPLSERMALLLRLEGFNLLNHGNYLGRGQTVHGDGAAPLPTFGQLVSVGSSATAIPAFANVDPPRMFQLQIRFIF